MGELTFEEFFNNVPLYSRKKFVVYKRKNDSYELNDEGLSQFLLASGFGDNNIDSQCNVCKKTYPFIYTHQPLFSDSSIIIFSLHGEMLNGYIPTSSSSGPKFDNSLPNAFSLEDCADKNSCFVKYDLRCTKDDTRYSCFVRFEQDNGVVTMTKVGQYPSTIDIQGIDFDCYKKILERFDAYDDYKKAYFSFLDSLYVGSFAYLRRVFEKMINIYCKDVELPDKHIETKIQASKPYISKDIYDLMKNLYSILSVSIHELNEEESKEYFESLKAVIEIQLEFEKTNFEKDETNKRLHTKLSKIREGIEINKK